MKKLVVKKLVVASILLFLLCASFASSLPAPFGKAKELALKAPPNAVGNHILIFEAKELSTYLIGYLPAHKIIGIGKEMGGKLVVAEYCEEDGKFSFWVDGIRKEADQKSVISFAFAVFRELVDKSII